MAGMGTERHLFALALMYRTQVRFQGCMHPVPGPWWYFFAEY